MSVGGTGSRRGEYSVGAENPLPGAVRPSDCLLCLMRPRTCFGVRNVSAATWVTIGYMLLGVPFAIHVDVIFGYPGRGTAMVVFMYPVMAMVLGAVLVQHLVAAYGACCVLYLAWCVAFGLGRGMGSDMFSIDGGNLAGIISAMTAGTVPYILVVAVYIFGR